MTEVKFKPIETGGAWGLQHNPQIFSKLYLLQIETNSENIGNRKKMNWKKIIMLFENYQKITTICNITDTITNLTSTCNISYCIFHTAFFIFHNYDVHFEIESFINPNLLHWGDKSKWIYLLLFNFLLNAISRQSFSTWKRLRTKMRFTTHNNHFILF